jgi:outer membrane protein
VIHRCTGIGLVVLAALETQVHAQLTLREAERRAEAQSPALAAGRLGAEAADARVVQSRAGLLPQVLVTGSYKYGTGNRAFRIGTRPLPPAPNLLTQSPTTLYDYLTGSLTATQLLTDFGQTSEAWRASRLSAASAALDAKTIRLAVLLDVRLAFFAALAHHDLVQVARDDLDNQNRHLDQVAEMIQVQLRPPIDLVQARANVGASELRRIAAENDYALAKADLERAMGGADVADTDIAPEEYPPVPGETEDLGALYAQATSARPDVASAVLQIQANERGLASIQGTYLPSFHLVLTASDAGPIWDPYAFAWNNLRWNYSAGVVLTWPVFEGLRTVGRVREARALVGQAKANRDAVDLNVRLETERARRTVGAAKTAVSVAEVTCDNARERLRLAEERYKAGAGTALDVSDAQLAYTSAAANRVQARYQLAAARAQLIHALGLGD